jgi:ligand-binding SRPBCC domain-containing protein
LITVHQWRVRQPLPISLQTAWDFFACADNLAQMTPPAMGMRITPVHGKPVYPGQILVHSVRMFEGIPFPRTDWMTEIVHVQPPHFFADEQKAGPFSVWWHEHHLTETPTGVVVEDYIRYVVPLGPIGNLANWLMVRPMIRRAFRFREQKLRELFQAGPAEVIPFPNPAEPTP